MDILQHAPMDIDIMPDLTPLSCDGVMVSVITGSGWVATVDLVTSHSRLVATAVCVSVPVLSY